MNFRLKLMRSTACVLLQKSKFKNFMSEHITALNLVLNEVQPRFSSLLRRVSKILKFANLPC
ncbi:hypothetical protein [Campylobacter concisus]|uniref:hypothetical protein n=1 Tax=Campylobacter concisus TaxID=199 RepID=UPI00122C6EE5|nr:hypothetical protein [Campylobacter concisus]